MNVFSVDTNVLSIDTNILSIDMKILSIDMKILSIDRNVLSIDMNILSIDTNVICQLIQTSCQLIWTSSNRSIRPIDGTLTNTTSPSQSEPEINGNAQIGSLTIRINIVSYPEHHFFGWDTVCVF